MSNEIYDLDVSKISRFDSNHEIQEKLAEFLDMMVKTSVLQEDFGRVEHVHIPYILSEDEYVERALVLLLSAFKILTNTTALQDFFSTKNLLVVKLRSCEIISQRKRPRLVRRKIKNQAPASNQVTSTFQVAATNTEDSDDSPGELKKET
ncbi:hypothetical protein BpHYR1_007117 [Brachionus plicatilis]|uniref:Uncharacterized protein n=1 Tax=Brachionus plicatilis TaxID=10195 RepID=A0A3M7QXG2_BRAPC|nr:hypothetical protein BpHYR1_007117 [Brachionus plicatilis]